MTNPLAQDLGGVVLLPCPFCGHALPKFLANVGNNPKRHTIQCPDCPGRCEFYSSTKEQAAAAWNARTPNAGGDNRIAWEARRYPNGLRRYMTQRQYDAQTEVIKAHYKPICECSQATGSGTHSAEIAGALRDAERYRWLRAQNAITETPDSWTITRCDFTDEDEPIRYWVGDDLDTAIDSAMQQGGGE